MNYCITVHLVIVQNTWATNANILMKNIHITQTLIIPLLSSFDYLSSYLFCLLQSHTFIITFVHSSIHLHSSLLSLRGENLPVVTSRDLNSGLPYSRPARYQLSYAAPFLWAMLHPTDLSFFSFLLISSSFILYIYIFLFWPSKLELIHYFVTFELYILFP